MKNLLRMFVALLCLVAVCSQVFAKDQKTENAFRKAVTPQSATIPQYLSFDPKFPPPEGFPAFQLSQDYPKEYDVTETFPWSEIDFRVNSDGYLRAVLRYALEGNVEVDFKGQDNATRKWYHTPWLHDDGGDKEKAERKGREYHHGLTRERRSQAFELHPLQAQDKVQNWAVSMYNARGGYTIGRVWWTPDGFPDPTNATFPDNAVAFKLLFTAAPVNQVPYLDGSFKWTANINPDPTPVPFKRVDHEMLLLQVDVAVKEPRLGSGSGWVFGTFVYDASQPGKSPWDKLVPVGASWGDDPTERRLIDRDGSYSNPHLRESTLNPSLVAPPAGTDWGKRAYAIHFGLGSRLNGPVDNPASSCISCHGRAAVFADSIPLKPESGYPMPILAGAKLSGKKSDQIAAFDEMFRLIRANSHLEKAPVVDLEGRELTFVTLDYSLQLSAGIRNFYQSFRTDAPSLQKLKGTNAIDGKMADEFLKLPRLPQVTRDEKD